MPTCRDVLVVEGAQELGEEAQEMEEVVVEEMEEELRGNEEEMGVRGGVLVWRKEEGGSGG